MRTIWKYPLNVRGWNALPIPEEATVVLAAIDPASGGPAIWVDHVVEDIGRVPSDELATRPLRYFAVFGTGQDARHVGSMIDRTFVWHIFERSA